MTKVIARDNRTGWQAKGNVCCLKLIPEGIRLGGDTNEIVKFAQNVMIHINTDSPKALILSNTILMPQNLFEMGL